MQIVAQVLAGAGDAAPGASGGPIVSDRGGGTALLPGLLDRGSRLGRSVVDRLVDATPPLHRLRLTRRLRRRMHASLGYAPDLEHPLTFNEKIGWRILNDRNPLIPLTTDKIAARDWVAARIGTDILVPLLGIWDCAEDVPWQSLPNRFVLKASHGWNMNLLVHDKRLVERAAALQTAAGWLRRNHYDDTGEWGYRDIPPRLLAEEMLEGEAGGPPQDFKFHVFGGRVGLIGVHHGRFGEHRTTFLDRSLRRLPVTQGRPAHPDWTPPAAIGELLRIAERLGLDFDYVRVDLYLVGGQPRFGELTHYDSSGCSPYAPREFDRLLGDMWQMRTAAGRRISAVG